MSKNCSVTMMMEQLKCTRGFQKFHGYAFEDMVKAYREELEHEDLPQWMKKVIGTSGEHVADVEETHVSKTIIWKTDFLRVVGETEGRAITLTSVHTASSSRLPVVGVQPQLRTKRKTTWVGGWCGACGKPTGESRVRFALQVWRHSKRASGCPSVRSARLTV